jgi:hypothetical protein
MKTRAKTKRMAITTTGNGDRQIIFTYGQNNIVRPLDAYEPGDIKETKTKLSRELNCSPEEITVRITGIHDGRIQKGSPLKIQLVDAIAIRNYIK